MVDYLKKPADRLFTWQEHEAVHKAFSDAIDDQQVDINSLKQATGVGSGGNTEIENLQNNQSAFIDQFIAMSRRIEALENSPIIATDATGRPGSPVSSYNPLGPKPRPQGRHTYDDFTLHDFGSSGGARYQSNFNVERTSVSGWYKFTFRGYIAHGTAGMHTEIVQLRERDGTWHFFEITATELVEEDGLGGTIPAKYVLSGNMAMEANTDYTIVLAGTNDIPKNPTQQVRAGFYFEYDMEFVSPILVPDPLRPETWGDMYVYMINTGRRTSKGDTIYIPETIRKNSSHSSDRVIVGRANQGQRYAIDIYNGAPAEVLRIGIDTTGDGQGDLREVMLMKNVDGSTQWDFGQEKDAATLVNDYWRVEFTADESGPIVVETPSGSPGERREYAALRLEAL